MGLETLEYEMARSLDVLKQRQADAKFAKTVLGRMWTWGGRFFAAYCVYRILSVRPAFLCPAAHILTGTHPHVTVHRQPGLAALTAV